MAIPTIRTSAFLACAIAGALCLPAFAQNTTFTAQSGTVEGSVGLKDNRRDFTLEEKRRNLIDPEQGTLLPAGEKPLDTAPVERLLTPGASADPPSPTSRPKPTRPQTAQNTPERPAHAVSAVANPLPLIAPTHATPPLDTPAFDAATFASPMGPTIVPESWIWERGGWAWSAEERAARLGDPLLARAAGSTPAGWNTSSATGPAGWLPEGPLACAAAQRIELALKVHRLAMTPDELDAWETATADACRRSYVLR